VCLFVRLRRRGVYRSSYRNARRLAATETNLAYRTADHLRWQQMDFVVGIKVQLSNNHNCKGVPAGRFYDICDELQGRYPKDFKFTGWHPLCRCYATPVLMSNEEFAQSLLSERNGEKAPRSANEVTALPDNFKEWVEKNKERIEAATDRGTLPYFIRDNHTAVDNILNSTLKYGGNTASALNKEYKGTAMGRDITSEVDVRNMTSEDPYMDDSFTINVARMQGFDAPAKLVSEQEFATLEKDSGDVLYRTVKSTTFRGKRMASKEFASQLYKADKLELNGNGRRAYGDGLYTTTSVWDGYDLEPLTDSGKELARSGSRMYGKDADDYTVLEMTFTRKPKIIKEEDLREMWEKLREEQQVLFGKNMSTYGCALGYDAMYCEFNNYMTIWNRSVLAVKKQ